MVLAQLEPEEQAVEGPASNFVVKLGWFSLAVALAILPRSPCRHSEPGVFDWSFERSHNDASEHLWAEAVGPCHHLA